jgi:hypothetical protein
MNPTLAPFARRSFGAAIAALIAIAHAAAPAFAQPPRPAETSRSVTLSLNEYNRLIDLASRPPQGPAAAPVPAVLSSADLRVRIEGDVARGVFELAGDVLRGGISRVNLVSGATLIAASAAGRPLPLIADGQAHAALLPGPNPFSLTLEWVGPIVYAPGRASFQLPVPPAGTARATFELPGDQADVRLSAGLITRRAAEDGRTIVEATLDPGSTTEVWWSMRDSAPVAAAREARTLADVFTLVTLGDSDVRMVGLLDITVVQGEPRTIDLRLPGGYELTGISGASVESTSLDGDVVRIVVGAPSLRRHQFLVTLERSHAGGSFTLDTGFLSLPGVQRERGEIAIEGVGTLELTATERAGMHRIDVRELNPALHGLTRLPLLSAFRYQRGAATTPALTLDVKRFADAGVLAAAADRAVATTLVTSEGRALTEIALTVRNRAQPFLKVQLPTGATIVSVEVGNATAKPVLGADGTRVPLLRPGFRPSGPYIVSFVYLHAGTPFARRGEIEMTLPKMDLPIGIVEWEVFAPQTYAVRPAGGNAIERRMLDAFAPLAAGGHGYGVDRGAGGGVVGGGVADAAPSPRPAPGVPAGHIVGRVSDPSGAVLPGATISVAPSGQSAVTDSAGQYVLSGIPSGAVTISASLLGFATQVATFQFDQQPRQADFTLRVAPLEETITVSAETPDAADRRDQRPSANVVNLQRRAAGVLPVRVDVPRAGTSHKFVKPLVIDQETVVKLRYRRR